MIDYLIHVFSPGPQSFMSRNIVNHLRVFVSFTPVVDPRSTLRREGWVRSAAAFAGHFGLSSHEVSGDVGYRARDTA